MTKQQKISKEVGYLAIDFLVQQDYKYLQVSVLTQIVKMATNLGFQLFGASTIQTESTIQWVYY